MTPDAELALKLLGRDPRMERRDQVGGPEPCAQWQPRPVHHRPRSHRRLPPTARADPQVTARLAARVRRPAAGTDEPLRPARAEHVGATRLLAPEPPLEVQDRQREVRARHAAKLRHGPDGANPVRTSLQHLHEASRRQSRSPLRQALRAGRQGVPSSWVPRDGGCLARLASVPPSHCVDGVHVALLWLAGRRIFARAPLGLRRPARPLGVHACDPSGKLADRTMSTRPKPTASPAAAAPLAKINTPAMVRTAKKQRRNTGHLGASEQAGGAGRCVRLATATRPGAATAALTAKAPNAWRTGSPSGPRSTPIPIKPATIAPVPTRRRAARLARQLTLGSRRALVPLTGSAIRPKRTEYREDTLPSEALRVVSPARGHLHGEEHRNRVATRAMHGRDGAATVKGSTV